MRRLSLDFCLTSGVVLDRLGAPTGGGGEEELDPAAIYVATDGNDSTGDGSSGNPYASLVKAHTVITDGQAATIYLRGGTYNIATEFGIFWTKSGLDADNRIKVFAYPGEAPILDFTGLTCASDSYYGVANAGGCGVYIRNASYTHWKGITIRKAHLIGMIVEGISGGTCTYHTFEQCGFHENGTDGSVGYGLAIHQSGDHFLVLNCDSSKNLDSLTSGSNSDGFQLSTYDGNNNVVRGCRAWLNGDDGFDFFALWDGETNGNWLVEECWAWKNGYQADGTTPSSGDGNGFKCGGSAVNRNNGQHTYKNCMAFENKVDGFDENEADVVQTFYNCTSFANLARNWEFFGSATHVLRNNVSYAYGIADAVELVDDRYNNWDLGLNVTSADFVSVSTAGVDGARGSDGSLPVLDLMKLTSTSKLVGAGTDVGIAYQNGAPDLGAYESSYTPAAAPTYVRTMYVGEQTGTYEFTAVNTRWQFGTGVSFMPDASTDYYVLWQAEVTANSTAGDVKYRLFDGTNSLAAGNIEPKDTVPEEWYSVGGVNKITSAETPVFTSLTIEIQSEGTHQVKMRNGRVIAIKKVATDQYVSTTAASSAVSTTEADVQTLTWTPPSTKDYLVIGSAGIGPCLSAPYETQLRLKQGATERSRNYALYNDAGSCHSHLVTHYAAGLTASEVTFTLAAIHSNLTNTATLKDRNLLALDVTGMTVYQNSATAVDGSVSNTQSYVSSYSSSPTIAATKKHLVLAASGIRSASTTISAYDNLTVDGVQVSEQVREAISTTLNTGFSAVWQGTISAGSRAISQQVKNESGTGNVQVFQAKQVVWQIEA